MCNRYVAPSAADLERFWHFKSTGFEWPKEIFPRVPGPFVRARLADSENAENAVPELVVGRWGLIPWFAKTPDVRYSTNNARSEELAQKASYKQPWARAQRCIIPAVTFDEPCWETGKNVWWRFSRPDGELWSLAGIWASWTDKETGEIHESYSMLTVNADDHPLMRRMHKPDPKLGPDEQDKRSVIPIEQENLRAWLTGSREGAQALLVLAPAEAFAAHPMPKAKAKA